MHEFGIKGRIIDAESHAPVVAAKVEDIVDPTKYTYSVIDGTFALKPVYGIHGLYAWTALSASLAGNYEPPSSTRTITIIAPGYRNLTIPVTTTDTRDVYLDAGTISLRR